MKKFTLVTLIITVALLTLNNLAIAADLEANSEELYESASDIRPVINSGDFIVTNKKAIFDASDSITISELNISPLFKWDFGDGSKSEIGQEVLHDYLNSGRYTITLTITQGNVQESISKEIFAYDKQAILITDQLSEFDLIADQAERNGVWLSLISAVEETNFLTEEKLVQNISAKAEQIASTDILMFYTDSSLGLQAFTRYWSSLSEEEKFNIQNKLLVKITDIKINVGSKLAQQSFDVIKPDFILLTRKEAINPIFKAKEIGEILNELTNRVIEFRIIDENSGPSRLLALSRMTTYFRFNGIPASTIYLILAFPFIAFFIAFARQVIGVSTFGVYAPALTSLSFLILGPLFGISVLFVVIGVSYLIRIMLKKIELLYIPRVALLLSLISLSFLVVIRLVLYLGSPISLSLAVFPMLVMSTISEKFISAQSEHGLKNALIGAMETIAVAIVAYMIVAWQPFEDILMGLPELVILPLLGDIIVGKFSGLRLSEYFRFRSLLSDGAEEE